MRKQLFGLILLFNLPTIAWAQDVKGRIEDTVEKTTLPGASVVLIRQCDSIMVNCTRADAKGNFIMRDIPQGQYLVMITFPKYADYVTASTVADTTTDLGTINMTLTSQLLAEVIVTKKLGAIRIKGDTIEFKADSFYTAPGATVETLLKRLPGIQVDKDGKITAQGEAVKKVLVDGEEFFSEDPTIVTRGLTADVVDKVQVYKKASEQEEMTGIKDGKASNTIDLKLKESAKKGYFGKLEAAGNGSNRWDNNALLNAFKGKRKLSVFGMISSTKMTQPEMELDMGGGEQPADNAGNWGQGFPKSWTGAAQYANNWKDNKMRLNAGYKYDHFHTSSSGSARSQYILPDTLYFVNQHGDNDNKVSRQRATGRFEWKLDSLASFIVRATGANSHSDNFTENFSQSLDKAGHEINNSTRVSAGNADKHLLNTRVTWNQKFRKAGRILSLFLSHSRSETKYLGFLNASNRFFNNDVEVASEVIDQQKEYENDDRTIASTLTYTEPLSRKSILIISYDVQNNRRDTRKTTLEKDPDGKYNSPVDSLTNDFRFSVLTQTAGLFYQYGKSDRFNLLMGVNVAQSSYGRKNLKIDSASRYSFTNVFPQAELRKSIGQTGNISVMYYGEMRNPSLEQVQPVADNTDPLNIRVGNPNLKQSFSHNLLLSYSAYQVLSGTGLFVGTNYVTVQRDIGEMNVVDAFGRRISRPINVNGNYQLTLYGNYSRKLSAVLQANVNAALTKSSNVGFVNEVKSNNDNVAYAIAPGVNLAKENKYTAALNAQTTYNLFKSPIRPDAETRYWTQTISLFTTVFLPWKLEWSNDCNVEWRQKTQVFNNNNNVVRWNVSLLRKILKNDAARLGVAAYDVLNQNKGITRNLTSNFISEQTNTIIKRYFMVTFIWNFKNQMSNGQME